MKNLFLAIFMALGFLVSAQTPQRIPLKSNDALVPTTAPIANIDYLLDDSMNTVFQMWDKKLSPFRLTFDLADFQPCTPTQLRFEVFSGGSANIKFGYVRKSDGQEVIFYTWTGGSWEPYWHSVDIPNPEVASFFFIESEPWNFPNDVQLWGTYKANVLPVAPIVHQPIKNFMMVNCHQYDLDSAWWATKETNDAKYNNIKDVGFSGLRVYDDISMSKNDINQFAFDPTYQGGFEPETFYRKFHKDIPGFINHLCWQGQSRVIRQTWWAVKDSSSQLDLPYGANRSDPWSWQELGQDAFVLGSRYGKNPNVPDYPLHVPSEWWQTKQQMLKGTGVGDWVEPWNEDNAWWTDNHCLTTSEMLTSMSVFYDGHKGLIPGAGVKNADPSMIVSSGGVANSDPWVLHEDAYWSAKNRGYRADGSIDFPFDLFQFHAYPSGGGQYSGAQGGIPMEKSIIPWTNNVVYAANKYANGMKTVIGEVGYDIHPKSPINAPAFSIYTAEQVRAMWSVRGLFKFSQSGLYAAEWYILYQDGNYNDANETQFATMAFLWQSDDGKTFKRRTNADYFKQLQPYRDYRFAEAIRDDSVQVLRFVKEGSPDIKVMWTIEDVSVDPTTNRPVIKEKIYPYILNEYGTLYEFNNDSSGVLKQSPFLAGSITLRSKPVIFVGGNTPVLPVFEFNAQKVGGSSALLTWSANETVDVQRSPDSRTWTTLSANLKTNQFIDGNPFTGTNFYRLKYYGGYTPIKMLMFGNRIQVRYVVRTVLGQLYATGVTDDINEVKKRLPRGQAFVVTTYNDNFTFSEKIVNF